MQLHFLVCGPYVPIHGCEERMGIRSGTKAHRGASTAAVAVGEKAHLRNMYRLHWSEPFSFLNTDLDNIVLDRNYAQKLKSEQWNMESNCLHCKKLFVCVCSSKVFQLYNFDIIWCTCRSSHTLIYTIIIVKTIYQQITDTLKSQKWSLYTNYSNDSNELCLSVGLHQLCQQIFWTKSKSNEKILSNFGKMVVWEL